MKGIMNLKEIVRLQEWLKAHGTSADDILDCIAYIAAADDDESEKSDE